MDPKTYETDWQRRLNAEQREVMAQIPCYDCGGSMLYCSCDVIEDMSGFAMGVLAVAGVLAIGTCTVFGVAAAVAAKLRRR